MVQDRVAKGELFPREGEGEENVADVLTKHMDRQKMEERTQACGVARRIGRHERGPQFGECNLGRLLARVLAFCPNGRWRHLVLVCL